MESLRKLPATLDDVQVPANVSVTRLASSGDCRLKAIVSASEYPAWPDSPESEFGRIAHSLMDLASRGQIQTIGEDPRPVALALDELLRQEQLKLTTPSIPPRCSDLSKAFTPSEWRKRRSLAIDRTLELLRSLPPSIRKLEPSQTLKIPLADALRSTGFAASELALVSPTLRLRARIDFLRVCAGGLIEISDFKSGSVLDDDGKVREVTALQLRLYGLLVLELVPQARLLLKVVSRQGTEAVSFSPEDIQKTQAWLEERISGLPVGARVFAQDIAVVGSPCWGCNARLVCPSYRNAVAELWKTTDSSSRLPLDIAGHILDTELSAESTMTVKINDLAGRVVKIHRLSAAYLPAQFDGDCVYWFFNLASSEKGFINGGWRHPRNFHELPASSLERKAWTLQVYRSA
jgi:RecB family exonuclease